MIRIRATSDIAPEVWLAVSTDVNAAIDASLEKHGLSGERSSDAPLNVEAPRTPPNWNGTIADLRENPMDAATVRQ